MENRYPLFAGGRILKKESLWDLRDYAYGSLQLEFMDYTDGILKGCRVRVEGEELVIGKGMLKCGDFIHLLQEEERLPFVAENQMVALKAVFEKKQNNPDNVIYQVSFVLEQDLSLQTNQIELCRFHLRTGSVLRDTYKNFSDMNTEYDTINLLHATMSGRGKGRIHPEILLRFAEELQGQERKSLEDIAYCYQILQNQGEVERGVLDAYFCDKQLAGNLSEAQRWETDRCFHVLEGIVNCKGNGYLEGQRQRVIFVE
ncbi:MAG: hypothetical protein J5988_14160 [Eubacterium sp.]|nr:hypothetical protein [Eubacterium sp.]